MDKYLIKTANEPTLFTASMNVTHMLMTLHTWSEWQVIEVAMNSRIHPPDFTKWMTNDGDYFILFFRSLLSIYRYETSLFPDRIHPPHSFYNLRYLGGRYHCDEYEIFFLPFYILNLIHHLEWREWHIEKVWPNQIKNFIRESDGLGMLIYQSKIIWGVDASRYLLFFEHENMSLINILQWSHLF